MSARACIAGLRADGKIDPERADRFTAELDRLETAYRKQFGDAAGPELASTAFVDKLSNDALQARRQTGLQLQTQKAILGGLLDHVEAGGSAARYATALFDHMEGVDGVSNISNRHAALRQLAWTKMGDFMVRFHRDLAGNVRFAGDLRDMVRELFGEKTGNANAAELAAAFGDTAEWLRQQFNVAGGHIGKLARWGLPQAHDSVLIARAGFQAWHDLIRPLLDAERMIDGASGRAFTDEGLTEALQSTWRSIASEGLDKLEPGQMTGSKLANQRADSRFLIFKDADSWLKYQERFGAGDPFNAIVGHIDGMTKDTAAMQVLGPNAGLTVRWLGDLLRKGAAPTMDGARSIKLTGQAGKAAIVTDRMWRFYRGELTMPEPTNRGIARFFAGVRSWNVASQLGGALLSAITTDPVFAAITAKFNGLSVTRHLNTYLRGFNPLDGEHRAAAAHAGLIFSEMTTRAERLWRDGPGMQLNIHEVSRRLADATTRTSLLAPHTVAMKEATGLSFMMDAAENAPKAFGDLDRADRLRYQRYGIDAGEWDYIRATPIAEEGGYKLLRPGDIASRQEVFGGQADRAALKMLEMIDSETKFGTPGELLRAQTALAFGGRGTRLQRGSYIGEVVHSATQYKTYSIIALMTHMERAIYGNGGVSRAAYGTMLPLFLTLGGVATIALKDIWLGKDPEPLEGPQLWARGFVQGGGAGILGDFVSAGLMGRSRTGGTVAGYVAGPTTSNIIDPALDLVLGNIGKAGSGKKTDFQHEGLQMAERNLPGSNIWYLNLAAHRLLLDQLDRSADPNADKSWDRMAKRARDQRTQFYWAPGNLRPSRAPDFANAIANDQEPMP